MLKDVEKDRAMYELIEKHNDTTSSSSYAYKSTCIGLDFDGHLSVPFNKCTQIPKSDCPKRVEEYLPVSLLVCLRACLNMTQHV